MKRLVGRMMTGIRLPGSLLHLPLFEVMGLCGALLESSVVAVMSICVLARGTMEWGGDLLVDIHASTSIHTYLGR